jgi:predicted NUDIX family NTP pyrophosphohydrolase
MIKRFDEFGTQSREPRAAAGIAIVLRQAEEPMILLVHPTNASWVSPRMGIPKGGVENGESLIDAAIRETLEETGIRIHPSQLNPSPETAEVWNDKRYLYSIHYFICNISNTSEIGLDSLKIPKSQLQAEEIDWAGFVTVKEAYSKVARSQHIILDRIG